jgi:signal transduction histidine kinase
MRTPLAAARMDVERFTATVRRQLPELTPDIDAVRTSLLEELDRLREFTRQFTSFATIPKPRPRPIDVARFVSDFATSFGPAWPGVELIARGDGPAMVSADGDMLRQVLVNLTNNSALAIRERGGTVTFTVRAAEHVTVDVTDSGPGVAAEIRNRLFEPYTTTRGIGEGMGLGLAISKKILLDHGGDLDYVSNGEGATFRLTFPRLEASA